jgi:hypothetical protein
LKKKREIYRAARKNLLRILGKPRGIGACFGAQGGGKNGGLASGRLKKRPTVGLIF